MPTSFKWSLPLSFPYQNAVHTSPLPYMSHIPHLPHPFWFGHLVLGEECRAWHSSLFKFLQFPVTSSLLGLPQHPNLKHFQSIKSYVYKWKFCNCICWHIIHVHILINYIKILKLTINIPQGRGLAMGLEEMDEGRHGDVVEESEPADVHSAPST